MGNSLLIGSSISETEFYVNSGRNPTFCMSFQPVRADGYVHKVFTVTKQDIGSHAD